MNKSKEIKVGKFLVGGRQPLCLIAGPCVIENQRVLFRTAEVLQEISRELNIPLIFKTSYDKANRLSAASYRGPGLKKGLVLLKQLKKRFNIPILSDVHCRAEVKPAAEVLDIIQIPALLCRQTDLVVAAARPGKVINLKKGQFMAPADMENIIAKVTSTGNKRILITERGTFFGFHNLVNDMRAIPWLKTFGYPVIFDATHSVQLPGGGGKYSSGQRIFASSLAQAAVAAGCDGVFMEVHPNPGQALCDGPNTLKLNTIKQLLKKLTAIRKVVAD
ncbi:MAG: 3-deoxy-8-phosphooctulonate synthase [Planctomycetota bacterium]